MGRITKPRDDMTTHEMHPAPITLVNAFQIEPEKLDAFLAVWRDRAEFMSTRPGFRSLRLLRAASARAPFLLVVVAEWEGVGALQAAMTHEGFEASARRAVEELGVSAHPGIYRVALEVSAVRNGLAG